MAHPSSRYRLPTLTLAAAFCIALLSACSSHPSEIADGPAYPQEKAQEQTLDIQVVRDETVIRFTNTAARSFPPCRMWINRWFSKDIPALEIGQTMTLNLSDFKDRYGDTFRAGGFFASERPTKVVLVQLEVAEEILGLVVIHTQE